MTKNRCFPIQSVVAAIVAALSIGAVARGAVVSTVTLVSNLDRPVWAGATPALPNHLFVLEKKGVIKVINMAAGNSVSVFMDIDFRVINPTSGNDERGLLGMAFHPNFASNRYFYVNYSNLVADNVIARYQADPGLLTANSATELILKTIPGFESNHNGGCLQFGPDGKLYCGNGDGGGAGDNHGAIGFGQDLTTLLGKLLRLDVDIPAPYIPSDNPNIGGSGVNEKWAYGLRNPWRFSFDRLTGDLYLADVGQNAWEEVNYVANNATDMLGKGFNYGWRCQEGFACFNSPSGPNCTCGGTNLENPVLVYDHSLGLAVIGGYVYRGVEIPGEQGNYFYGDFTSGRIWSFKIVNGMATGNTQRMTFSALTSFGEDARGEIYLVNGTGTTNGTIRRIVPLCNTPADINADCAKNLTDAAILVNVLLGLDVGDPALVNRSDVNDDGSVNGLDVGAWVASP